MLLLVLTRVYSYDKDFEDEKHLALRKSTANSWWIFENTSFTLKPRLQKCVN